MNKVAHYLQEHLDGEVMTALDARKHFATDGSVFTLTPSMIVYPRNENDIRKTARFAWQLAERGRVIPITARGGGSDRGGAALGSGIVMVFPAHLNRILELDSKSGRVTIEPGIIFAKLQQALQTHGRFLPVFPSSIEYSTVGGAIANNGSGAKSVKYGRMREFVKSLRVVLANGEVIETGRLNKRELNKKLGLSTYEGEIYRALDALLEENRELVEQMGAHSRLSGAGYDLADVRHKDGSSDLTPLFVGSQGTLGIISEAVLGSEPHNPRTTLIAGYFNDAAAAQKVILELKKLPETPSAIELVDDNLLSFVDEQNPNQLKGLLDKPFPKLVMLIEFDSPSDRTQKRLLKKALKILGRNQVPNLVETEEDKQDQLWKIRHAASTVLAHASGQARALPLVDDGVVPADRFQEYLEAIYRLCQHYQVGPMLWGHGGDTSLRLQPVLDLAAVGDRQKAFKLMDDYYKLIISLGGNITAEFGDGRLRGPYLKQQYGADAYALLQKVKQIFDPYNILNPGVKINVGLDDIKPLLRSEYNLGHWYNHLPRP